VAAVGRASSGCRAQRPPPLPPSRSMASRRRRRWWRAASPRSPMHGRSATRGGGWRGEQGARVRAGGHGGGGHGGKGRRPWPQRLGQCPHLVGERRAAVVVVDCRHVPPQDLAGVKGCIDCVFRREAGAARQSSASAPPPAQNVSADRRRNRVWRTAWPSPTTRRRSLSRGGGWRALGASQVWRRRRPRQEVAAMTAVAVGGDAGRGGDTRL